jgi:uncharacterized protein (DUF2267 family)
MKYHEMLGYVSTTTGADKARAEKITRAFLETLGQRLPNDEARHLAAQLPEELKDTLHPTTPDVKKLTADEFLNRFARLADLSSEQASDMAKAVWQALEESVSAGELDDVRATLPEDVAAAFR